MKCLILAAGYATRLYPLTENFPKPLLKVGPKTIIDHLLDNLDAAHAVDGYIVVSNHKFAKFFDRWAGSRLRGMQQAQISVLDDGTSSSETRLGAVRDMQYAIDSCGIDDDLLVMAGDNLLSFSLAGFIDYFRRKETSCAMRYYEESTARLQKCGVAVLDEADRIVSMQEKPLVPLSHWCCPPFYIIKRSDIPLIAKGIADGCGTDAPGSFIAWLCRQTPVHAWQMPGSRYDIGDIDSYRAIQRLFDRENGGDAAQIS